MTTPPDEVITDIDTVAQGRRAMIVSVTESSKGRSVRLEAQTKEDFGGWRVAGKFYIRERELEDVIAALNAAKAFLDE